MFKSFLFLFALLSISIAQAEYQEEPQVSTAPIGSPFYRQLAGQLNMDIKELVKYEKKGFGRTEVCALIIISSTTGKPMKEYGKRRLKDRTPLSQFAAEAHLDYNELIAHARQMKTEIEAMGDKNLPPPVFEPTPSPTPGKKSKKKDKQKKEPS